MVGIGTVSYTHLDVYKRQPLGTVCTLTPEAMELSKDEQIAIKLKQGRSPFGVELKISRDGESAPRDGSTFGNLMVRGPAIAKSYFKNEGGEILDEQGFFDTGDVANIDPHGYMPVSYTHLLGFVNWDYCRRGNEFLRTHNLILSALFPKKASFIFCISWTFCNFKNFIKR